MPYQARGKTKSFPVFDCDSHVFEPREVWDQYIPAGQREFAKTHFYRDPDRLMIVFNGRVTYSDPSRFPYSGELWHPGLTKKEIGSIPPGTPEWDQKIGRNAIARDPHARLKDMDACGIDQVMVFPSTFVRLPQIDNAEAARICARAYNDWVHDYCSANPKRLFPCAVLPAQEVDYAVEELRRTARLGFKAGIVRPVLCNGRYPTFPEFDPLWREFEELDMALTMHTFIAPEPSSEKLAERMTGRGNTAEPAVRFYSPAQFVPNIMQAMGAITPGAEPLAFIAEATSWTMIVLMTGWLEKFPRLRVAVLESNAGWLPLVLEKAEGYLELTQYIRDRADPPVKIGDPREVFYSRCFIGFEGDEETVFRLWDLYEDIGLWASDMPHHDASDAWEAMERMTRWGVAREVQAKMLGGNARRLYGIEPVMAVTEAPQAYEPVKIPTYLG